MNTPDLRALADLHDLRPSFLSIYLDLSKGVEYAFLRKRRKECAFCTDRRGKIIDYKNVRLLRDFLDDRARIRKARQTGNCRKHQRKLGTAIRRAREIALLEYTAD